MINRQKLQIFIDEYKQKFINDLDKTCKDLLDTNDNKLIDLDEEYNIPQSEYIKSEPMIHLDVDKILNDDYDGSFNGLIIETDRIDTKNGMCLNAITFKKLSPSNSGKIEIQTQNNTIRNNCPINTKLTNNEYIIKFYMIRLYLGIKDAYTIIYITNYGRIINAENIKKYMFDGGIKMCGRNIYAIDKFKIIENNKLYFCSIVDNILTKIESRNEGDFPSFSSIQLVDDPIFNSIQLVDVPIFNYKIPKIFIDVIDAFHKQDNDLMQTSCKKYLETLNKTKNCDKIVEKDRIIEEQKNIISQKDKEIERLKLELEELRKFYIES